MKILELKAEKRTIKGSKAVNKLRDSGQIPAILYGHKQDNVMLCLNEHDFTRILHTGTRMINLTVDNKKESALIKDVQYDNLLDCFFQAEDGIRDDLVTGVQTCALPISSSFPSSFTRFTRSSSTTGEV